MSTSIEAARRAKPRAAELARAVAAVTGVGLTKVGDSYAVKVNLRAAAPTSAVLPETVDGVRVLYEVTGPVSARLARAG